jgi:hypothetical protein
MVITLTRRVIVEKYYDRFFEMNIKGYNEAFAFFDDLGGYSLFHIQGATYIDREMIINRANQVWEELKENYINGNRH